MNTIYTVQSLHHQTMPLADYKAVAECLAQDPAEKVDVRMLETPVGGDWIVLGPNMDVTEGPNGLPVLRGPVGFAGSDFGHGLSANEAVILPERVPERQLAWWERLIGRQPEALVRLSALAFDSTVEHPQA